MRHSLLLALCCIFVFAKCKKEKNDGNYFGYAKAELNGIAVTYNEIRGGTSHNSDTSWLVFERWESLIPKEVMNFGSLVKTINLSQRIHKRNHGDNTLTSNYYTLRDDGDIPCDDYNIYEPDSLQNFITITSFNPQTKEIKGTFQATYLIDSARVATKGKCRPSAPDTIRIRNGEFYTKIF